MHLEINDPLVSALFIPVLFIVLQYVFTCMLVHSEKRKLLVQRNPATKKTDVVIKKYIITIEDKHNPNIRLHADAPIDLTELRAYLAPTGQHTANHEINDIRELRAEVEKIDFGLQLAVGAMAVQLNTLILLAPSKQYNGNTMVWGIIWIVIQIILASLVTAIHNLGDPDKQSPLRKIFTNLICTNLAGVCALAISFVYLSTAHLL